MCGVRDYAHGLNRTVATVHNMKADGRIPKPARTEPGHRGACRWYEVTVEFWFAELHKLLNERPKSSFDDCAREATRRATRFDKQFRSTIRNNQSTHRDGSQDAIASA